MQPEGSTEGEVELGVVCVTAKVDVVGPRLELFTRAIVGTDRTNLERYCFL